METARRIIRHAKIPSLHGKDGRPNFNVRFYALNKKGEFGAASVYGPTKFAVHNGKENKIHRAGGVLKNKK
jgi:hypothetical protein